MRWTGGVRVRTVKWIRAGGQWCEGVGVVCSVLDPICRKTAMDYSASIPPALWKVCRLRRQDGSLSATGFKLGQEDHRSAPI
jgi:hypothetical protein